MSVCFSLSLSLSLSLCVCVCVCALSDLLRSMIDAIVSMFVHVYVYVCVCVKGVLAAGEE